MRRPRDVDLRHVLPLELLERAELPGLDKVEDDPAVAPRRVLHRRSRREDPDGGVAVRADELLRSLDTLRGRLAVADLEPQLVRLREPTGETTSFSQAREVWGRKEERADPGSG